MGIWSWGFGKDREENESWAFVADFPFYAGGVERSFGAWVVGMTDEYADEEAVLKLFRKDYPKKNPFENLVEFRNVDQGDDATGDAPYDLAPTPGRINNGNGLCADEDSHMAKKWGKKNRYPAFESVAIFLARKPTGKELRTLVARALSFHEVPKQHEHDARPKVLRCRLVREVTRIEHAIVL